MVKPTAAWALCLVVVPLSTTAFAKTRWVSDQLPLDMRSGNSNAYRVVEMLEPGTKVTIVSVDQKAGFSQVITSGGSKGWLANRYLMNEPSSREQLEKAQATITRLTAEAKPMQEEIAALKQQSETLRRQLDDAIQTRTQSEEKLAHVMDVSANAVAIDQSNQSLMEANQLLQHEIGILKGENDRLKDSSQREWFLNGALAVGLGALLAIIIPRITPSRRNKEWL